MKLKILTVTGLFTIAMVFYFTAESINTNNNIDLAGLMSINTANAETPTSNGLFWKEVMVEVTVVESSAGSINVLGSGVSWDGTTETYTVKKEKCVDGWSVCDISHWW